jgi:hypothetical protein
LFITNGALAAANLARVLSRAVVDVDRLGAGTFLAGDEVEALVAAAICGSLQNQLASATARLVTT